MKRHGLFGIVIMLALMFGMIAFLFVPIPANATVRHLVINEVYYKSDQTSEADEFVEIYNPTGNDVNVSGWLLVEYTGSGDVGSSW
ncbi:MAG: lamin tail domain-containing protein, partial [Candidatus Hodarchaeota archaeon]